MIPRCLFYSAAVFELLRPAADEFISIAISDANIYSPRIMIID